MFELMQRIRQSGKNLIVCGDYNTAHHPIDLANPKQNETVSGFLPIERAWLDKIEEHGWVDTFRQFNQEPGEYTWWTYRFGARSRNVGWRIDYFFTNIEFLPKIKNAFIRQQVMGSDHCPLGVEI
jgi:exodeoxyribonuclease-3